MKKLNVGCGLDVKEGFVNMDIHKFEGVDVVWDLNKTPFPFKDNTFSYVLVQHVLEHLDDVTETMQELWRITKKNGIIDVAVPHFASVNAVKDPTHKNFFALATFQFFEKPEEKHNYYSTTMKMNYKITEKKIIVSNNKILRTLNPMITRFSNIYERFFCYILPPIEIRVKMKVIK